MKNRGIAWWRILSWQLYDFADTIYSMNVYSLYFGRWVIRAFGASSLTFSLIVTAANLAIAAVSPLLGAASDVSGRRLPFLRFFALGCALATAAIGLAPNIGLASLAFVVSYVFYSAAGNFYQALLPGISSPENVSRISGVGVGLGYLGAFAGIKLVQPFVPTDDQMVSAFLPTAVLFFVFALPCLVLVPDFTSGGRLRLDAAAAYRRVAATLGSASRHRPLFVFLIADFLYENAVSAVISFMGVYSEKVAGFTGADLTSFLIYSIGFAMAWSLVYGWVTDRVGPKPAVIGMLVIWLAALGLVIMSRDKQSFYLIGPLVGIGLGSTVVSSRTYLVALTPVEKSGEFFGLFSLSGKSAGVLGLAVWSLVLWALTGRIGEVAALRAAVGAMMIFVGLGLALVLTLPHIRPTGANVLRR